MSFVLSPMSPKSTAASMRIKDDIVHQIVSFLGDTMPAGDYYQHWKYKEQLINRDTLVSCTLVSRAWRDASLRFLYHTVCASSLHGLCTAIATTLEQHTHLLVHVRVLRLSAVWMTKWWPMGWTAFSNIPNLYELEVQFANLPAKAFRYVVWASSSFTDIQSPVLLCSARIWACSIRLSIW
jgi:hypothetical protein